MSPTQEQLVRKALAALSEIADACGDEPARKTLSLRFLLMFTFVAAGADPGKRWKWDAFWTAVTTPSSVRSMDAYLRGTGARSALNGICGEVGFQPDAAFLDHLRKQRDASNDR